MQGMGKGHAWVNGHSIGQFWPSYLPNKMVEALIHVITKAHKITTEASLIVVSLLKDGES